MDTNIISEYLASIQRYFKDENSSEMSYRTPFQIFLEKLFPQSEKYHVQHDQRASGGNKPDFIVSKNGVPLLYIEVKNVGEDLNKIQKSNQASRYFGYDNLIISDYLSFRFYRNGQGYNEEISLGKPHLKTREIIFTPEHGEYLSRTIIDFTHSHKEAIKSGKHLAKIMGGKAQRIRDNVIEFLNTDKAENQELRKIMTVIKEHLVHDLDEPKFADMYAQTLVYGLFAARYHDTTKDTFSRQEARDLIPKTNPFLQHFFDHIAGVQFPKRLDIIVSELCEVFTHADVRKLMHDYFRQENLFGEIKESPDPVIHFYEDFLLEYDPTKKMEMGVFYTPLPVVRFIVRGIDEILKKEFGIIKGLSDNQKIQKEIVEVDQKGKQAKTKKEYHKVQVLDVATGTGTFLNEVVKHIHDSFAGQEGRWVSYAEEDLIPRIHGFELMMASYTIAHLKLGMTLQESGVQNFKKRLGIYLTNTLDTPVDYSNQTSLFGFLDSIADESKSASRIKKEYPIMCVIGNPPYSGISQNKDYTENNAYKVEPGGKTKLQERKHWLDDDYVKFIRFAESLIEKNGEGIVGMITAHGYIDNPTFRGMRWHLRKTFDKIYVVDLHGNSNKKETSLDGSKDENVFDIKTGVSIIFGIKKSVTKERGLATVYKLDLYGIRKDKFEVLDKGTLENIQWQELLEETELWTLEGVGKSEYQKGFSVAEMFPKNSTGIVTGIDRLSIFETKEDLEKVTRSILNSLDPYTEFGIKDGRRTKKEDRVKELREASHNPPTPISYRPFDTRWMYYTTGSEVWINSPRPEIMQHFVNRENIGLLATKAVNDPFYNHIFVTENISEAIFISGTTATNAINHPLYLYINQNEKIPNINKGIWSKINETVGETTPENILDYIYATLHSPSYREKYKEFLKKDFPRVPYPESKEKFFALAKIGEYLRNLHLMTSKEANEIITTFPEVGTDEVENRFPVFKETLSLSGHPTKPGIYINEKQFFGLQSNTTLNYLKIAWNFYIGGYQPAQKYLKDRKGRKLSNDEIEHYQKIIKVLVETDRLMKEIDQL